MNIPNVPDRAMPEVSGSTDVYFILGDPVEQVKAPESFNRLFARHGIKAVLVPVQIAPGHLEAFVGSVFKAPNVKGLWVTIPHKVPLLALLDACTPLAQAAGAVNAVRREADGKLTGALFDGEGFVAGLAYAGIAWAGKRVLILGAGGAAAAIAASLSLGGEQQASTASISLYDPAPGRAEALAVRLNGFRQLQVQTVSSSDPSGFDLVINASPLGLRVTDPLPCDVSRMRAHAAVVDILMKNQPTPFLRAAMARGLQVQAGFEMMIQQTHLYLRFFGFEQAALAAEQDLASVRAVIDPASHSSGEAVGETPRSCHTAQRLAA